MGTTNDMERFCAAAYPQLVGALGHHFGDPVLAEDLAQDALVRACDRWETVGDLESPVGWAYRVGVNLGNSWFRRRAAERRARQRHGPDAEVHRDRDVADRLAVPEALQQLTRQQREAIVLRHFLGLSTHETAEVLGSTPGAVRGLTHRASGVLRDLLDVTVDSEETSDVS
jgi:RNA polymerase sigma-70 factor (sigma-E family)